ncbi:DUF3800 domain-containing protein [Sporosarcina sp. 6E9]|uniref:DUF3800 domain-containing protein n=1 Tax=Sporosarcina sp. 6E9 TaxID=2819235 RepID=UPI001B3008D4|nr:DUF3800 domain-containing protein [Sporosarcina sp. 6E9]
MRYSIFFDESNKLDNEKKYSYYGAFGCDTEKTRQLNIGVEKVFERFGKKSEFHFTEYKNDRNLNAAFCFLHFFINLDLQVNIFIVNNKRALHMAAERNLATKDLRKLFYVKIPERLFYGLTREQDFDHNMVDIYLDHSPEYGGMRVYSKIKEQMNAHSLYRQLNYQVNTVKSKKSEESYAIQMIDMLLGIIVYLIEKSYLGISKKDIVKSDLIYRFLIEESNLEKFQKQVNIFKWDESEINSIEKVPMSEYLSEFMMSKSKFDIQEMSKIITITSNNPGIGMKNLREKLGYSSNMLQLLFGYQRQIKGEKRNQDILDTYHTIFEEPTV